MSSVAVGVIGAGVMGADHARQLHRWVPGAHVAMAADLDVARAQQVAAETGCRATGDPRALIADPAVQAVLVASHDSTHAEFVTACVRAGKAVLCEKPLAPSLAETAALLADLGDAAARLVSVGFMRRFDPGYVDLKAAIDGASLGAPLMLHCVSRGVRSGPGATSEYSVTGSSIHDLDVVPWLLGSPVTEAAWVSVRQTAHTGAQRDPQLILLRTADGTVATVETYLNARYGYDIRCEAVLESGAVSLAEPVSVRVDADLGHTAAYAADWRPRFAAAYRLELTAWIAAVTAGADPIAPMATAADGLRAAAVADAVIRSMHGTGTFEPVVLPALVAS